MLCLHFGYPVGRLVSRRINRAEGEVVTGIKPVAAWVCRTYRITLEFSKEGRHGVCASSAAFRLGRIIDLCPPLSLRALARRRTRRLTFLADQLPAIQEISCPACDQGLQACDRRGVLRVL